MGSDQRSNGLVGGACGSTGLRKRFGRAFLKPRYSRGSGTRPWGGASHLVRGPCGMGRRHRRLRDAAIDSGVSDATSPSTR